MFNKVLQKEVKSEAIRDRFINEAPGYVKSVLPACELGFIIYENKKTLIIKCPNSFAANRINHGIFGNTGKGTNMLGIKRYLIDNGEGIISLHSLIRGSFMLVGYFNGNINQLTNSK